MEDSISVKSNDSIAVSDEFEIVNGGTTALPQLNIAGDGSLEGLWHSLGEMLNENIGNTDGSQKSRQGSSSGDEIEEICDVLQDCTIFNGVSYLGAATINAPKSDLETLRNMRFLNEQTESGIKVSISVPSCSEGSVVLYDGLTNVVMQKCAISSISCYIPGKPDSNESACFAFTWTHGESKENSVSQCYVFRCEIPEAVGQVSACFKKAFQKVPNSLTTSVNGELDPELSANVQMFLLELTMEIKEDDGKGGYSSVPRDRNCFKIRSHVEKQFCITVSQPTESQKKLEINRCFGVLIAPGRNVKDADMQLLDMVTEGTTDCCNITALWDPKKKDTAIELLNSETDGCADLTIGVDLVINGLKEPIRLLSETHVKIYSQNERFWYFGKRFLIQRYFVNIKEVPSSDNKPIFEVVRIDSACHVDRNRLNLTLNSWANYIRSPSITSIDTLTPRDEYNSDGDEPMLSGTGEVNKEDFTGDELTLWSDVLKKWGPTRPKQLPSLVKRGIPEILRGQVWQRLAQCDDNTLMDNYRILFTQDCNWETVIKRDINRTFPAHEFFKESGGQGQDALLRISKAYAVYDSEVGYCQGFSFLAATLLLHMPEEQAFCVLLKVMYDYGIRELYKDGFECLYLRLYQLNCLMKEQLPQLYQHFREMGIESHMFASQWFLTLYSARFPLHLVFHIIDVFLLQGTETLFQVAIALLQIFSKDLMALDFESILKYFRVSLPKRCRNEDIARAVMQKACNVKVKKLKKYEQDFIHFKEAQDSADQYNNDVARLKMEVVRSEEEKKRLEEELLQVKEMLKREVSDNDKSMKVITGYKEVLQRIDKEQLATKASLNQIMSIISDCDRCSNSAKVEKDTSDDTKDIQLSERITELELELAKAKLAQVEAECKNQYLTHQLSSAVQELESTKNTWQPWLSKTFTSIKEVAVNKTNPRRESTETLQSE